MHIFCRVLVAIAGLCALCVTVFRLLVACGVHLVSGPHKVVASDDVIWLLPWESGRYSEGNGFISKGASVSASEKGGVLTVNGKLYGVLKLGDSVDVSRKGVVLVNGQVHEPR